MSERKKWVKILDQLWQRNCRVNNYYRMATGAVRDQKLKQALLCYATCRAQFSFELYQRIKNIATETSVKEDQNLSKGTAISLSLSEENIGRILQKCISAEKDCLAEYSRALTKVNDGITREILIRHRARITSIIRELQHLYALLSIPGENKNSSILN